MVDLRICQSDQDWSRMRRQYGTTNISSRKRRCLPGSPSPPPPGDNSARLQNFLVAIRSGMVLSSHLDGIESGTFSDSEFSVLLQCAARYRRDLAVRRLLCCNDKLSPCGLTAALYAAALGPQRNGAEEGGGEEAERTCSPWWTVEALVSAGADVNGEANEENTRLLLHLVGAQQDNHRALPPPLPGTTSWAQWEQPPLVLAARLRWAEGVRLLLSPPFSSDVDATTTCGETALVVAVRCRWVEGVRLLLEKGADPGRKTGGITALHYASLEKGHHLEIARILLHHGADPNARNKDLETPLLNASRLEDPEMSRTLLHAGAEVNLGDSGGFTPLSSACLFGNFKTVELLVESGADVNGPDSPLSSLITGFCEETDCSLPLVTGSGPFLATVRFLLARGAEPDGCGVCGRPAIVLATQAGFCKLTEVLCREGGADVDAGDRTERTALSHAAERGDLVMARALLGFGADVNRPDAKNRSPLVHAAKNGKVEVVRFLLGQGATQGVVKGLLGAVRNDQVGVLRLLLSDDEFRTRFDDSNVLQTGQVLRLAVRSKYARSVKVLLDAGVDPLAENNWGYSSLDLCPPLLWHTDDDSPEPSPVTQLLVARLVQREQFDFRHRLGPGETTVLDRALKAGYFGLVRYLVMHGARCRPSSLPSLLENRFQISALLHMVHQRQMQQGLQALRDVLGLPDDILRVIVVYGCSVTTWDKAKELLVLPDVDRPPL